MATSYGSLIVAFDEEHLPAVRAHSQVEFVGGVTLDPNGPKAEVLTRIFAENVALQLASRPVVAAVSPLPQSVRDRPRAIRLRRGRRRCAGRSGREREVMTTAPDTTRGAR